jgi:hypothetical protein
MEYIMISNFKPVNGYPDVASTITPQELYDYYHSPDILYYPNKIPKCKWNIKIFACCKRSIIDAVRGKWISNAEIYSLSKQVLPNDPNLYFGKIIIDNTKIFHKNHSTEYRILDQTISHHKNILFYESSLINGAYKIRCIGNSTSKIKYFDIILPRSKSSKVRESITVNTYSDEFITISSTKQINVYELVYNFIPKGLFI